MATAERGSDGRANDDFAVGKGKHISGGGIVEVRLVKSAAFLGRNKDDTEIEGQTCATHRRKAGQSRLNLTTEVREVQPMPALAIDPVEADGFSGHGDPEDSEFGGGGYSAKRGRGHGGRSAIRFA